MLQPVGTWLDRRGPLVFTLAAFVVRVLVRPLLWLPGARDTGYDFYLEIARAWVHGHGLCEFAGGGCALRLPVYPLFLSLFLRGDTLSFGWIVAQAAMGAAIVYVVSRIGLQLFDRRTAVVAAALAAVSPYAVAHDPALQDTVVVNLLLAAAFSLLLQLRRPAAAHVALGAGMCLALVAVTTARVELIVVAALLWAFFSTSIRNVVLIALPVALLCGAWLIRNDRVIGSPVWTTESGESLWAANNAQTMAFLPFQSIDGSVRSAYDALDENDRAALAALGGDEVAQDRLVGRWGRAYVAAHPFQTVGRAVVKIVVPLLPLLSPARGALVQVGFAAVYIPIHLLALWAAWRSRSRRNVHGLAVFVLAAFALTTGIYWAHTSHASVLDPFWFVYAAAAAVGSLSRQEPGATI